MLLPCEPAAAIPPDRASGPGVLPDRRRYPRPLQITVGPIAAAPQSNRFDPRPLGRLDIVWRVSYERRQLRPSPETASMPHARCPGLVLDAGAFIFRCPLREEIVDARAVQQRGQLPDRRLRSQSRDCTPWLGRDSRSGLAPGVGWRPPGARPKISFFGSQRLSRVLSLR